MNNLNLYFILLHICHYCHCLIHFSMLFDTRLRSLTPPTNPGIKRLHFYLSMSSNLYSSDGRGGTEVGDLPPFSLLSTLKPAF